MAEEKKLERRLFLPGYSYQGVSSTDLARITSELENENLSTEMVHCFDNPLEGICIQLEGNTFTLICKPGYIFGSANSPTTILSSYPLSNNLAEKIRHGSSFPGLLEIAPALHYPEAKQILAKVQKEKPISLRELRILMELAEAVEKPMEEALQKPLATLLGGLQLKQLTSEDLAALKYLMSKMPMNWKKDLATLLPQIYHQLLPVISNQSGERYKEIEVSVKEEEAKKINLAREVLKKTMDAIYIIATQGDPKMAELFVHEICQRPNPEAVRSIEEMMHDYDKLPAAFRKIARPFFEKEYDLTQAQESFFNYFNSCGVYAELLAFLYRKADRVDARDALIDQMLQEVSLGETTALTIYLKELVEKDQDPQAILRIKKIMLGENKHLSKNAKAYVLQGILSLDKVYKIFEPFLKGEEQIEMQDGTVLKKKHFDLEFFARTELEPFFIKERHIHIERYDGEERRGIGSSQDWSPYINLIKTMMQRHLFSAVQGHLEAFYSDLKGEHPPWRSNSSNDSPLRTILCEAFQYKPMQDFLAKQVQNGNPFLGFEVLNVALSYLSPIDDVAFMNRLKKLPLDSIRKRIGVLSDEDESSRNYFYPNKYSGELLIAKLALDAGFEKAKDHIIDGFKDYDDRVHNAYLYYFADALKDEKENKTIATSEQKEALRDYISTTDLSYMPRMLQRLIDHADDNHAFHKDFTNDLRSLLPLLTVDYRNRNVLSTLSDLYNIALRTPMECGKTTPMEWMHLDLQDILSRIIKRWIYMIKEEPQRTTEAETELKAILGLLGKLASTRSLATDPALIEMTDIATSRPSLRRDVVLEFFKMADQKGYATLSALWSLLDIYNSITESKEDSVLQNEMEDFLKRFDPRGVVNSDCHPLAGKGWRHVLKALIMIGNRNAYEAWRDFLVQGWWHLAQELPKVSSLEKLNTSSLYMDFIELGRLSVSKEAPGWLAPQLAQELNQIYSESPDLVPWVLEQIGNLAQVDPLLKGAAAVFDGDFSVRMAFEALKIEAKTNDDAYVWLSLLSLTNIPIFSEKARFAMMNMNKTGDARNLFETHLGSWISEHQHPQGEDEIKY